MKDFKDNFTIDTMFWSLLSLEKDLIKKKSTIFDCLYINYKNHAILFSGSSGMRKSTQADLWKNNRNVSIINGDRRLQKI